MVSLFTFYYTFPPCFCFLCFKAALRIAAFIIFTSISCKCRSNLNIISSTVCIIYLKIIAEFAVEIDCILTFKFIVTAFCGNDDAWSSFINNKFRVALFKTAYHIIGFDIIFRYKLYRMFPLIFDFHLNAAVFRQKIYMVFFIINQVPCYIFSVHLKGKCAFRKAVFGFYQQGSIGIKIILTVIQFSFCLSRIKYKFNRTRVVFPGFEFFACYIRLIACIIPCNYLGCKKFTLKACNLKRLFFAIASVIVFDLTRLSGCFKINVINNETKIINSRVIIFDSSSYACSSVFILFNLYVNFRSVNVCQ